MANPGPDSAVSDALRLLQQGQAQNAEKLLAPYVRANPRQPAAHFLLGVALYELGQKQNSLPHFDQAIALQPQFADAHYNRGSVLADLGKGDEAIASFQRAIALKPDHANAHGNLAAVLFELKRYDEALASYDRVITLQPGNGEAFYNKGTALLKLQRPDDALPVLNSAIALNPNHALAHSNRGVALNTLGQYAEAAASLERALALNPGDPAAHTNLVVALLALRQLDQALRHCDRALELAPNEPEIHVARGDILRQCGRPADAVSSYSRAIALRPDHAATYVCRADAFVTLKQYDKALADYGQAVALQPDQFFAAGYHLHTAAQMCDWTDLETDLHVIRSGLQCGCDVSTPFSLLAADVTLAEQRRCAEISGRRFRRANASRPNLAATPVKQKLRVGYFSPDFAAHAVSYLTVGVLEEHDREKIDVIGFSYGPPQHDSMSQRVRQAFDQFIDVTAQSDDSVAATARDLGLDIAVDLAGYTGLGRPGIFAQRAAPVQVNYLGFPGTMGAGFIDYIIADPIVIPDAQKNAYGEKVVHLPECFQANDAKREIGPKPTRQQFGLTDAQFVFCSFNSAYKFNPTLFKTWFDILRAVDNSMLWLVEANPWQADNLRRFASQHGITPERLVFTTNLPYAQHLARYQIADLALDTLPFNGGTTTSDALWAGLPVVTCLGDTFAGRMAGSLLNAAGIPELVTPSLEDYAKLAVTLAQSPDRLQTLRQNLTGRRSTSPLFNTALVTRRLEAAYADMMRRHVAGQPPDHITVR